MSLQTIRDYFDDENMEQLFDPEDEDRGPALEIYGTDLTMLARQGLLEECFGRETELLELMEILVRRQKNNPVLVGDAGVGKTAIVELFATKIVKNLVPFILEGRSIVSLDLARIVAGSRYRGEFELRFQRVLDEVMAQPHIIIFIDEIHNIGGTGSAEGSLDAANILKPVLSRSGFQCIGATTVKEYQRIEKDPALNRRFQPIKVKEPSIMETVYILYGLRPSLESFHNVVILPGAIHLAATLAARYIYDRFLPDKAIDLVDRAAAREVIKMTSVTEGSVLGGIVNSALTGVGRLKLEAFRRGDIGGEYILQEIENAYRNFMLTWLEDPLNVPEKQTEKVFSPISQELFELMRTSVLRRVDELLFSSSNARYDEYLKDSKTNLSIPKNQEILEKILYSIVNHRTPNLSLYRISLFLFKAWTSKNQFDLVSKPLRNIYIANFRTLMEKFNILNYVYEKKQETKEETHRYLFSGLDFLEVDIEERPVKDELLSEREEKKIHIYKEYIEDIKPLVRKGFIQSLQSSSTVTFEDADLKNLYALLGFLNSEKGKTYLGNLKDPDLIRRARQIGDFSFLKKKITQLEINNLLSDMTGIPIQSISIGESQKLLNIEATLHKRVIGQDEAITAIAKAIRRSRLGIQNPNRPIASFLFCGPTGVGKTEVTKALAVSMFGSESDMIRFDMSEFMEKFTVSRLIGSPPGYVGYDEGGQLTDAVRRKAYSVVLFDEIEKAHPDILNILLQILEDGRLTDSQKRLVPFDNTIIIMTSNAAAEEIQEIINVEPEEESVEKNSTELEEKKESKVLEVEGLKYNFVEDPYVGVIKFLQSPIQESFLLDLQDQINLEMDKSFLPSRTSSKLSKELTKWTEDPKEKEKSEQKTKLLGNLKSAVFERLSTLFLPEFLNRLDDIIIFQPLKFEELRKICDIMIRQVSERVKEKKIVLFVDEKVKIKLTREGYNPLFGARPLRRLVTKYIEDLISENLLKYPLYKKSRHIQIILSIDGIVYIKNPQLDFDTEIESNPDNKTKPKIVVDSEFISPDLSPKESTEVKKLDKRLTTVI